MYGVVFVRGASNTESTQCRHCQIAVHRRRRRVFFAERGAHKAATTAPAAAPASATRTRHVDTL